MPVPQADTLEAITKSLAEISQQMESIKETKNFNETLKTIGLIVSPLLSAIIANYFIFRVTKNKEIRFKKNDISGEIYGSIHELRQIFMLASFNAVYSKGYLRIVNIFKDPYFYNQNAAPDELAGYTDKGSLESFNTYNDKITEAINRSVELSRILRKHVGQYRQYLNEKESDELEKLLDPVNKMVFLDFDYSSCKTPAECEKKMNEFIRSAPKEFTDQYDKHIKAVYKFLDKNK